jgi:hypothetical protein
MVYMQKSLSANINTNYTPFTEIKFNTQREAVENKKIHNLGDIIELHALYLKNLKGLTIALLNQEKEIIQFHYIGCDLNKFTSSHLLSKEPQCSYLLHFYWDENILVNDSMKRICKILFKTLRETEYSVYDIVIFTKEDYFSARFDD